MKRILLIEDEKILAQMYKEEFEKEGFEVILAFDAQEGFKLAKEKKPNLILLDIILPKINGISFLEWIKKDKVLSQIPIVVISNYDDPRTKKEALKLGVKEYLLKTDFTPKELVQKIKNYFL